MNNQLLDCYNIKNLKTEYIENPIGLNTKKPRFSWQLIGYAGLKQKSYRIKVASTKEKLLLGDIDLWDSKEIETDINFGIEYEGKILKSGQGAYWLCEVCDAKGEKKISETAYFELGLLNKSDWKGSFISMPLKATSGAMYFRRDFFLENKKIAKARVYVCSVGFNELYLNGEKISESLLTPVSTDYSKRLFYTVNDVTDKLIAGGNCIGVIVGHGWWGERKLLLQLNVEYSDGRKVEIHTDCAGWWNTTDGPIQEDSVYDGEVYDARKESKIEGWSKFGYDSIFNNGWGFSMRVPSPSGKIVSQTINPIKVISEYKCEQIYYSEKRIIYTTHQNIAGWVKIIVEGDKGSSIEISYAEQLTQGGKSLNKLNLRSAKSTDKYILKGGEQEVYAPRFTYHGFEFIEIKINGRVKIISLVAEAVSSSVSQIGSFECSDERINKLHKMAVMTERANLQGVLSDCPQRDERFGWVNDLTSRIYQTICNFDMSRFLPKVVADITDTQQKDGTISDTAPSTIGERIADPVVIGYLLMAKKCYEQYGDKRVIEENYKAFRAWTLYLLKKSKNGILEEGLYGDWVSAIETCKTLNKEPRTAITYISTAYLCWYLELMKDFAIILENSQDEVYFEKEGERVKNCFNQKFYNEDSGYYGTDSQTCNAIALSLNLCQGLKAKELALHLAKDIERLNYHTTSGNQGYRHLFYSLSDYGYNDLLYKLLTNKEYPGWGYMLESGATTVWERWEKQMQKSMNSFCHPMFASYDGWLYNKIAGINIDSKTKGAKNLYIKPNIISNVKSVNASIKTIQGEVFVRWEQLGKSVEYLIKIPANTEAIIDLEGEIEEIKTDGLVEIIDKKIKAESGEYKIKVKKG